MASNSTHTSASGSGSRAEPSSSRRSRTSSGPSGAAAEPEPATTYHVRDYQNPAAGAAFHAALRVARFSSAATAAWHAGLWRFQSRRWHSWPQ